MARLLTDRELELFAKIMSERTSDGDCNKKQKKEKEKEETKDPAAAAEDEYEAAIEPTGSYLKPEELAEASHSYASAVGGGPRGIQANADDSGASSSSGGTPSPIPPQSARRRRRRRRAKSGSSGSSSNDSRRGSTSGSGSNDEEGRSRRRNRNRNRRSRRRRLDPAAGHQSTPLTEALQRRHVFDTPDGLTRRRDVLDILEGILCAWSDGLAPIGKRSSLNGMRRSLSRASSSSSSPPIAGAGAATKRRKDENGDTTNADLGPGLPPPPPPKGRVAVICFGSYRLGVHNPSADIDALALAPPHCTRGDFFASLVAILGKDDRVTDLHPVPG